MFALVGSAAANAALRAGEAVGRLHDRARAAGAIIDFDDRLAVGERWLLAQRLAGADAAPGEVHLRHRSLDFVPCREARHECRHGLAARRYLGVDLHVRRRWFDNAEAGCQQFPQPAEIDRDEDRPGACVPHVGRQVARRLCVLDLEMQLVVAHEGCVHHRHVDVLAQPGARAHDHGGQQGNEAVQAGVRIRHRQRKIELHALHPRRAVDQAKLCVHDGRIGRALRFRAVAAEAGDRQHDELRVGGRQRLIADA